MGTADTQRNALTATELLHLMNRVHAEEVITGLYTKGAAACGNPQLRSFFTHQAERNGERLEELTKLLQSYAGISR